MGEERKGNSIPPDEIIAAFDRERAEANELRRRHTEQVRSARAMDRPVRSESERGHPTR